MIRKNYPLAEDSWKNSIIPLLHLKPVAGLQVSASTATLVTLHVIIPQETACLKSYQPNQKSLILLRNIFLLPQYRE